MDLLDTKSEKHYVTGSKVNLRPTTGMQFKFLTNPVPQLMSLSFVYMCTRRPV